MRNLSTETYDAVVEALLPHMTTEDSRRTELLPVLSRMKAARVDWSGSSHSFTVRLVNRLTRTELIAVLSRLRVGDEQHDDLEQLCVRIRHERRLTGARLRRTSPWTYVTTVLIGVAVLSPLGWWRARDGEPSVSQSPSKRARFEPELRADALESTDDDARVNSDAVTPISLAPTPEPPTPEPSTPEPSTPEPPTPERAAVHGASIASKPAPARRGCQAIARELAQVLSNDAPRPGQCDEDGFMTAVVGADGTVSTSGPLRGYPIEDGKSCGKLSVKCPASW